MSKDTVFLHMVYFWLQEGAGRQEAETLADGARRHLGPIPGVISMRVGFPAGTSREVVENSYGVALQLEFANLADHDAYQDHPDHHAFIRECKALWSRVRIFDSIVSS